MTETWELVDPDDFSDWEWVDCLCQNHNGFHENCDPLLCRCDGDDR